MNDGSLHHTGSRYKTLFLSFFKKTTTKNILFLRYGAAFAVGKGLFSFFTCFAFTERAMFRRACVNTGAIFPSRKITLNFVFFFFFKKTKQNKSKTWKKKSTHEVERKTRPKTGLGPNTVHLRVCVVPYTHALEYTQTHPLGPQGPSFSFYDVDFVSREFDVRVCVSKTRSP